MLKIFIGILSVAFVSAGFIGDYGDFELPTADDVDFQLPAGTITCQIDSPGRDECIREAVQDMIPKLGAGMESLNIPPLDPYIIEHQSLELTHPSGLRLAGSLRKGRCLGGSSAQIQQVRTKITRTHISYMAKAFVPEFFVEGYYSAEGGFNNMKLKAKGYLNITLTDISAIYRLEGNIITVNGKEHLKLNKFGVNPQIGPIKVFATGLLPDPELNGIALDLINKYSPVVATVMAPQVMKQLEPLMIQDANQFLAHVPLRKLLYYGGEEA